MGWQAAAAIVAVIGTGYSIQQQEKAQDKQEQAARENKKIQQAQRAQNEAQAAQERRKQIREERIKRARIIATSEAAGVTGSSGELGALGSLSTNLSAGIGANEGALNTAADISLFSQNAANFSSQANQYSANAQMGGQVSSLALQMAPVLDNASSLFKAPPVKP